MISAEVDGRLPYMTYPEPWRGPPKQPPEFLRPPPKPLSSSRYNGAPPNGARLAHAQRSPSRYSPPAATPVNLTQPKDEMTDELPYSSYRIFQHSFPPFNHNPYQIYSSPYTSILRSNYVPPPLSPLETYSPTTSSTVTNSGTFLSPQATYSPPSAVKPNQSLLRDNRKPPQQNATVTATSFKVPSGKEGSLKHRILTRPEDSILPQRCPIDLQRPNATEVHRNWIPSSVSPPQSPAKTFNNNTVPVNFSKGSLIQLANGALRKVEDMKTEDFVLSADKNPELRLENSTVIKIEENPITRTVTITLTYNHRRTQIFFALFLAAALAAPVKDEAVVDVIQDTEGYYKYTFVSKNITREEEREHDGSVKGYFSYLDIDGEKQTVHYTSGADGFSAEGTSIPAELPEVAEARKQHEVISETIRNLLPALKSDSTVDEVPEVPLTKDEFLQAVVAVLHPELSVGVPETPEVDQAKKEFFKSFETALAN